uniref:JNK-interacting protein 1 n=1 Tax=Romanomermis culicivorax TaxID=13658 RepID=A0A915HIM8_ROMCU
MTTDDSSGFSSDCTSSDLILQPTHRGMHRFVPRHQDELLIEVGDPIFVDYESDDQWCQGMNLRTGLAGIFPNTHVFEVDLDPFDMNNVNSDNLTSQKDTFFVTHLASVEVAHHKGNDVLTQAIHKVIQAFQKREDIVKPAPVLLDISFRGVHVIDKSKKNWFRCPNFDYFYSLQNISFCGAHPKQLKYFGFITKHPLLPRFACHVFMSNASTEPVVESIGRAFQKSYNEYMAFAHPTEDIYME